MDQSDRYANLNLTEKQLIEGGRHVLCAYIMKPKEGFGNYLQTAAHFAAESSTGTNVEVSTTDDFTRGVDALVYEIDEARQIMKIAYPVELFDRNVIDGRAMIASFLTLTIGNNQGMGDVEYGKMHDFYVPPAYLKLFDGPCDHDQGSVARARPSGGERRLHRRHDHQAEARPAAAALRQRLLRFLARRRFHQERRAAGQPGLRAVQGDRARGQRRHDPRPGQDRPAEALLVQHHRRRSSRDDRARRIHPRDLRRRTPTMSPSWSTAMSPVPPRSPRRGALSRSSTCTITAPATAP